MIEVLLDCPRCKKLSRVEREGRVEGKPVCGHGTILTPLKLPNLLQCACGTYLDDRHLAKFEPF
jgi:hypothetical protein